MAIMKREVADIILEAYYWDYKLVDNVATKDKRVTLAYIAMYKDYEYESTQISEVMTLRDNLIEAYSNHPDNEVCVKLTIKEEHVNI
jgi:hypothetical protein